MNTIQTLDILDSPPDLIWKKPESVPEPSLPEPELTVVEQTPGLEALALAAKDKLGCAHLWQDIQKPKWEREKRNLEKEWQYQKEKTRAVLVNALAFNLEQLGIEVLDEDSLAKRKQYLMHKNTPDYGSGLRAVLKEFFALPPLHFKWFEQELHRTKPETHLLAKAVQIAERIPKAKFFVRSFWAYRIGEGYDCFSIRITYHYDEKKLMGDFLVVKQQSESKQAYEEPIIVEYIIDQW